MKTILLARTKLIVLTLFLSLPLTHAQTTGFTYQGRLSDNGSPFTGSAEFQPTLWSAASSGTQIAVNSPAQVIVAVTNGLFTLPLDFGTNFPGADRWLQLEVRTTIGSFTLLTPRQRLTPTPYAITANTAGNLSGTLPAAQLSGAISSANFSGTYSSALTLNNAANNFTGSGAGLTGVNADLVDGLDSTSFWKIGGNNGTTPGTHFFGTTDNQALEFKVNGQRGLRIEPNANGAPNVIGGSLNNFVGAGVVGATIGGGGATNYGVITVFSFTNRITADFGTIGGGSGNLIQSSDSTIGGGGGNIIDGLGAAATIGGGNGNRIHDVSGGTIGGGTQNLIQGVGLHATISGGDRNTIQSSAFAAAVGGGLQNTVEVGSTGATIGGGYFNTNSGSYATIPGGRLNRANGEFSFAAGRRAKANHDGAFVWGDSTDADFSSTAINQFLIRASGGAGIGVTQPRGELHVGNSSNIAPLSAASQTILIENAAENGRAAFIALAGPGASDSTNRVELQFEANENERRAIIGTLSNHEIQFRQDNSTSLTIWTNGFVGIGTASPTNRLMVVNARCDGSSWINSSDRNLKENFAPVNPREVLAKVAAMPISRWNYKDNPGDPHVGPVAQDFRAAFGLGADDVSIATVDADGVALAAIQGLNQKLEEQRVENTELKQRLAQLEQLVSKLATKAD